MGALIFKHHKTSNPSTEQYFTIIDGQQRLTTILILLKVLAEKTYAPADFYKKFHTANSKKSFIHNQMDNEVFSQLFYVQTRHFKDSEQNNKIFRCYQYFFENITDDQAFDPQSVMNLIYFVKIELEMEDDEQEIFETINSLGVALTPGELLKNELFNREEVEYYFNTWGKTFESMALREYWNQTIPNGKQLSFSMLELFLRSYYFLTAELPPGYEHLGSLFKNYQNLLRNQYPGESRKIFIDDLVKTANVFRRYFDPLLQDNPIRNIRPIHSLVLIIFALQITHAIPYILYVLKNATPEEQDKIFTLLELYLLRRNICKLTAARYNLQFKQFIRDKILTADDLLDKLKRAVDNTSKIPTARDVVNAIFYNDSNLGKNRIASVVYYLLEIHTKKNIQHPAKLNGYNNYSLIELLPKKLEHWFPSDSLDESEKKSYLYAAKLLGNFILSPKKIASDKSWSEKKAIISTACDSLYTAQGCLAEDVWNQHTIILRTCKLTAEIQNVWSCDIDDDFILPDDGNIKAFIEKLEESRDIYNLVQIINHSTNSEIKNNALKILEKILFFSGNITDQANDFMPHLLTEDFVGKKPFKWTWENKEYLCAHWSDLFKDLSRILYNKSPELMRDFCCYGGDSNICNIPRKEKSKPWDKIGENCYIYTAISVAIMQKSIQNMLRAMNVDIREIHIYLRG